MLKPNFIAGLAAVISATLPMLCCVGCNGKVYFESYRLLSFSWHERTCVTIWHVYTVAITGYHHVLFLLNC